MSPAVKRHIVVPAGARRLPISSALRQRRKLQPFIDPDIGKHRDREYGIVAPYECHSAARDHTWRYLPDRIINRYGRLVDPTLRQAVREFQGIPKRERKETGIIKPKWNIERSRNWWHKTVEENPFLPTCADWYTSPTGVSGNTGAVGSPWNLVKGLSGGSGSIVAGDTLYYRSGTYYGGYTASMSGTALNPIKIKPFPGEQATFDQYIYGTITQALPVVEISAVSRTTNVVTATVPSGHGFVSGQTVAIRGVSITSGSGSFTGDFALSSTGATTLTYSQSAANATGTGGHASGGSVTLSLTQGSMTDPFGEIVINAANGPGNVSPTTPASTNKAEAISIFAKTGSGSTGTITNIQRGWNGSGWNGGSPEIGYHHSNGSAFYTSVDAMSVTGDHLQFWGSDPNSSPWIISKVQCSNPLRAFSPELGGIGAGQGGGPTWERSHAGFTASNVTGLEIIGLCIKDSNDGIFITGVGGGHVVSAGLMYNNGTVDSIRGHGQPCYIHTETSADFVDLICFSNFGSGSKFYGVNGSVRACVATRVHSFNNAAPASYTGNPAVDQPLNSNKYVEGNWFMGSENDPMFDCAMYDSVTWHPYDSVCTFPAVKFGHGQQCNDFVIDNNWFIGGDQAILITLQDQLTFTRNIVAQNTTGASGVNTQSDNNFFIDSATTAKLAAWTWGTGGTINQYWDKNRLLGSDSHTYPFLVDKDGTTGTNEFGSTGHQRYDVPADSRDFLGFTGLVLDYHEGALPGGNAQGFIFRTQPTTDIPTRSHVAVWKTNGTSIGTFNLPAAELTACGLVAGDSAIIVNAIDYFTGIAGGANKITLTNWDGSSAVSIAGGSFTRENPIGFTTEDWRGNTWTMGYGELIVFKTASGGAQPDPFFQKDTSALRVAKRRQAKMEQQGLSALAFPVVVQIPVVHREVAPMCLARRQQPRVQPQGATALSIPAAPAPASNETLMGQVLT